MRTAVLFLGVCGGVLAGFKGVLWMQDAGRLQQIVESSRQLGLSSDAVSQAERLSWASYFLIAGCFLGIGGGFLTYRGSALVGACMLLAAGFLPALFAFKSLVFTVFLPIAAAMAASIHFGQRRAGTPTPEPTPTPANEALAKIG